MWDPYKVADARMEMSIGTPAHLRSIPAENHESVYSVIGLVSVVDTIVGVKINGGVQIYVFTLAINNTANFKNALCEQLNAVYVSLLGFFLYLS